MRAYRFSHLRISKTEHEKGVSKLNSKASLHIRMMNIWRELPLPVRGFAIAILPVLSVNHLIGSSPASQPSDWVSRDLDLILCHNMAGNISNM